MTSLSPSSSFWTKIISENENDVELKINAHMFEKYFLSRDRKYRSKNKFILEKKGSLKGGNVSFYGFIRLLTLS